MTDVLPTANDVREASTRLRSRIMPSPVLESEELNRRAGCRVLIKAESLQHGGSFKIRGALNGLLSLNESERRAGVVTFSSGNHAQGVALAARWLGMQATIVMPSDAPRIKRLGTERAGARVVLYDRHTEDRERIGADLAESSGAVLLPPFDHPEIIAGQGTVGLEVARFAQDAEVELEALYCPCGGGGLIAGCALAMERIFPDCGIFAVEPEGYAETKRSLESGRRERVRGSPPTLCDALMAPTPGAVTFAINLRRLAGGLEVTDAQAARGVAFAARYLKLVLEPSGAVALGALLGGGAAGRKCVAVVLSGANIDPERLSEILAKYPDP
ncbi:MAG: threonine/serine dehydratase [Proteobacteria bacterium]|nr:threonine/serine dehydratase [Pseudomonadota bacterium]MYJ94715.1 threonine/serine dehydratase [Pseudomonadota bacterium]